MGSAVHSAAVMVRDKALSTASKFLEEPEENLELFEGTVRVKGRPEESISLGELAGRANPMRGAVDADVKPGLEATAYYAPPHASTG